MDLSISQMQQLQKSLYEPNKETWPPMEPEYGKDYKVGEVIAVLKKKGTGAVISDPAVREAFLEEMADVLMYYQDVLLRFGVTPEEIEELLNGA